MKLKLVTLVSLLLCAVCFWSALSSPASAAQKKYIVGIDGDYPPYSFIGKDGKPAGFDVESVQWIAKQLGFTVEIRPTAWDGIIPALLAKKIDMVYSGMTASPERGKVVDFSKTYWSINQYVAVKEGSALTMDEFMAGKLTIGTQRGCTAAIWIEDNLVKTGKMPADNLRLYDNFPAAEMDMEVGRVDGAMMDDVVVKEAIRGKPARIIGSIQTGENYAVAVRKSDKELKALIDKGLDMLMKSPKWEELKKKYKMDK
ncbi:amino acid ABC transporter substrate-binding protein [Synergistales bacterium]|nr:amino acid ABC transporter substrate-binding protein [Synergistales bacterium]